MDNLFYLIVPYFLVKLVFILVEFEEVEAHKKLELRLVFSLHFFRALPLPACFTTEQSTVEASLFDL